MDLKKVIRNTVKKIIIFTVSIDNISTYLKFRDRHREVGYLAFLYLRWDIL